jgi:two-component system nitrate/nitrite sensor histidine kinase NarQ
VLLSVFTSAIALLTLASSQRDAEAINIAGSLRMQSYRLGYEMQRASPELQKHRQSWQQTLSAPALQKLDRWYVPDNVKQRYQQLHLAWQEMDSQIAKGTPPGIRRIFRTLSAVSTPLCWRFSTIRNTRSSWLS